jgi:hypothetical protein
MFPFETSMSEAAQIILALAFLLKSLPPIIWSIRCAPDSPNYRLPAPCRQLPKRQTGTQ